MTKEPKWRKSKDGGDLVEILDNQGQIIGTAVDGEQAQVWISAPDLLESLHNVSAYLNLLRHRYCDEGRFEGLYNEVRRESEKVRAAIEKVEGR